MTSDAKLKEIRELRALLEANDIDQDEFDVRKTEILNRQDNPPPKKVRKKRQSKNSVTIMQLLLMAVGFICLINPVLWIITGLCAFAFLLLAFVASEYLCKHCGTRVDKRSKICPGCQSQFVN